jgi:mitogen-activated protein kinase 1/3
MFFKDTDEEEIRTDEKNPPASGSPAKSGFKLTFDDLNEDFVVPRDFRKQKKLGKGAYGKVMQVLHTPS